MTKLDLGGVYVDAEKFLLTPVPEFVTDACRVFEHTPYGSPDDDGYEDGCGPAVPSIELSADGGVVLHIRTDEDHWDSRFYSLRDYFESSDVAWRRGVEWLGV